MGVISSLYSHYIEIFLIMHYIILLFSNRVKIRHVKIEQKSYRRDGVSCHMCFFNVTNYLNLPKKAYPPYLFNVREDTCLQISMCYHII